MDLRIRESSELNPSKIFDKYLRLRTSADCRAFLSTAYLDPSFEAMVRCQLKFSETGYSKLAGVQRYFDDNVRDDYANGQLDVQVETVLADMKELAIYGV